MSVFNKKVRVENRTDFIKNTVQIIKIQRSFVYRKFAEVEILKTSSDSVLDLIVAC
jgi:hypothetical protein